MSVSNWCPTENDVIDKTVVKLKSIGFNILSTCNTKEHGTDIVAEKNGFRLLIEAKGATSALEGSKRNGKPFNRNQAHNHISVAIYKVMNLRSEFKDNNFILVGICLPFEKNHREFIERVRYPLERLNVIVLWVKENDILIETKNEEISKLFLNIQ